jgi:hypothetical protein
MEVSRTSMRPETGTLFCHHLLQLVRSGMASEAFITYT